MSICANWSAGSSAPATSRPFSLIKFKISDSLSWMGELGLSLRGVVLELPDDFSSYGMGSFKTRISGVIPCSVMSVPEGV